MTITTVNDTVHKTYRKPIKFEKIEKRWYAVYSSKIDGKIVNRLQIPVRSIKEIKG